MPVLVRRPHIPDNTTDTHSRHKHRRNHQTFPVHHHLSPYLISALKLEDGADLVVVVLMLADQAVTAGKVRDPRPWIVELGRRPSVGAGCECSPTRSAESRIDNALIVII